LSAARRGHREPPGRGQLITIEGLEPREPRAGPRTASLGVPGGVPDSSEETVPVTGKLNKEAHTLQRWEEWPRQGMSWTDVSGSIDGGGAEATRKRFERALDRIGRDLGLRDG
jgi:hypothetical protein